MVINNNRYDLSDRLIHFFRRVDLAGDTAPAWPEDPGYASISESEVLQPAFLLRHAIRMGRLYATWSIRKGRRTIHGKRPVVCFTEMPIAAFIEGGRFREAKGQAMSPYGLVFPKAAAFRTGARPVIYGLTGDATAQAATRASRGCSSLMFCRSRNSTGMSRLISRRRTWTGRTSANGAGVSP